MYVLYIILREKKKKDEDMRVQEKPLRRKSIQKIIKFS